MNISAYIKRIASAALAVVASLTMLSSCNGAIYDDEGDCEVVYKLRFRYDMNMKFADAFAHEVTSVNLYAFSQDGALVWQTYENGDRLAADGYDIVLPLPPGKYKLMAWCGLDNQESFTVPNVREGDVAESLHCKLNRTYHSEDGAISSDDLHPLFHGVIEAELPDSFDGGEYVYTMPLTKDTNVFRIVLQHLSGQDIDVNDFTFKIEDQNGWLHHDNSLRDDENITYHAWSKYSGSAGVDIDDDTRAVTNVSVAVAELTTSRLTMRDWNVRSKPMLTIRKAADNQVVAKIPVVDYALLVKGNYNRNMSDQEYLDRQDEYNMTFFLDENNQWVDSHIIINSWRVVLNKGGLD